jgi:hypothetical protein
MISPFPSCTSVLPRPWRCNPGWPQPGPVYPVYPAPVSPYAGYFIDRQSRFYLRGLRRGGIYLDDVPVITLWLDNGLDNRWDPGDVWLP